MRVFVISLPDADKRRGNAQRQFDEIGVPFEFFDAVRGQEAIRDRKFEGFDEASFLLNTGRRAAVDEIGCFASHRELWKRCVELGEPIMIMEDDFDLLPRFASAFRCANELILQAGFLRLQTSIRSRKVLIASRGEFRLERYKKTPHGLMCYCLSPTVAERFVEATRMMDAPVDVFTKKFWEHGQPMYALTPYTVAPSVLSVDTTIVGRRKSRKSWSVAGRRLARKAGWYWHRWLFNLRQRFDPKKRFVAAADAGAPSERATSV